MSLRGGFCIFTRHSKRVLLSEERGMALLITVMTISLLVALTVEFHRKTWQKFLVSNNYKVQGELEAIAFSGVNIARALLEADKNNSEADSLLDGWALLEPEDLGGFFPINSIDLSVSDLSGRLSVNNLVTSKGKVGQNNDISADVKQILLNLLESGKFKLGDEDGSERIVDALIDWIDEDDRESDLGAEDSYYQSLNKSYSCRNGPIQYVEELLLVRGVTPALLYGEGEQEGLINYITVYGDNGKINLNTAPTQLLKSMIPAASDELIARFDGFRKAPENRDKLGTVGWYKTISGWPGDIEFKPTTVDTNSKFFQISSAGNFDTFTRKIIVDIERDKDGKTIVLKRTVE